MADITHARSWWHTKLDYLPRRTMSTAVAIDSLTADTTAGHSPARGWPSKCGKDSGLTTRCGGRRICDAGKPAFAPDRAAQQDDNEEGVHMSEHQQAAVLRPETLVDEFKKNGVTHVLTIPDSETNYLYELLKRQDWLDIVPTAREGETFGIALGLFIAGKLPWCSYRTRECWSLAMRCAAWRSIAAFPWYSSWAIGLDSARRDARLRGALHRAVPERLSHQLLPGRTEQRRPRISAAFEEARATKRPVCVLIGDEYHGFNR